MKKTLSLAVVLVAATGLSIGFRPAMSGTSEASIREPSGERLDRSGLADKIEGAALVPVDTGSANDRADREFARVAAAAGDRLLDRARQSPDNPHLLRQAAAHYRAALAHEPTARDAGDLFAAVREKVAALDRAIARLDRPGVAKPTTKTALSPAIVKAPPTPEPPPTPVVKTPRLMMVGPDGVEIRRSVPRE
jgi:hypothetical protein